MNKEDEILYFVIDELIKRDVIDTDTYYNCFGCKSWDEITKAIKDKFLGNDNE